jgi:hypothetical protein
MKKIRIGAFALLLLLFALLVLRDGWNSNNQVPSPTAQPSSTESSGESSLEPSELVLEVSLLVIGKTETDAIALIDSKSGEVTYRVVRRDDEIFAVTMDYRTDRINLEIDKNIVTAANIG